MSKRNVAYIKPSDPAFIRRIKEQIGYKEGPNVNTKRQRLDELSDGSEPEDEAPQIVVVKPGDLSAEQVTQLKKEEEEGKADLNKRVVFKRPPGSGGTEAVSTTRDGTATSATPQNPPTKVKATAAKKAKKSESRTVSGALSFDADQDEQD